MFEFEIMVTGYTIVVATTAVAVSRCISRKKINKLGLKVSELEQALKMAGNEIKALKEFDSTKENS